MAITLHIADGATEVFRSAAALSKNMHNGMRFTSSSRVGRFSVWMMKDGNLAIAQEYQDQGLELASTWKNADHFKNYAKMRVDVINRYAGPAFAARDAGLEAFATLIEDAEVERKHYEAQMATLG